MGFRVVPDSGVNAVIRCGLRNPRRWIRASRPALACFARAAPTSRPTIFQPRIGDAGSGRWSPNFPSRADTSVPTTSCQMRTAFSMSSPSSLEARALVACTGRGPRAELYLSNQAAAESRLHRRHPAPEPDSAHLLYKGAHRALRPRYRVEFPHAPSPGTARRTS